MGDVTPTQGVATTIDGRGSGPYGCTGVGDVVAGGRVDAAKADPARRDRGPGRRASPAWRWASSPERGAPIPLPTATPTDAGGDPDLTITQMFGQPLTDDIARLPGVESTKAIVFVPSFIVSPIDGTPLLEPNPFAGNDDILGARIVEGRFTDPTNPNEFTVNRRLAEVLADRFGLGVGDQFDVVSYSQEQVEAELRLDRHAGRPGVQGDARRHHRIAVGLRRAVAADGVLTVVPRAPIRTSASCRRSSPRSSAMTPIRARCSTPCGSFRTATAPSPCRRGSSATAPGGPCASRSPRCGWSAPSRCSPRPIVIAQIVSRVVRVRDEERESMLALGWTPQRSCRRGRDRRGPPRADRRSGRRSSVAYALSSLFPLGVLDLFEPDPGPRADWLVAVAGVVGLAAVVVATAVIVGWRRPSVAATPGRRRAGWRARSRGGAPGMPLSVGARFALSNPRGRRSWTLVPRRCRRRGRVGRVGDRRPDPHDDRRSARPLGRQLRPALREPVHQRRRRHRRADRRRSRMFAPSPARTSARSRSTARTPRRSDSRAPRADLVPTVLEGRDPRSRRRDRHRCRGRAPAATSASATPSRRSARPASRTSSRWSGSS